MKAMILAAGRGTRLAPLTDGTPKPLLEVCGTTLIERHLARLAAAGFRDVVINVAHLGHLIEQRLGDGGRYGVSIAYSREGEGPLETGGGIARALPLLGDQAFLVVNADIWTNYSFAGARLDTQPAHLVLVPNPAHHPGGDFALDGAYAIRAARQPLTYAGIAILEPRLFRNRVGVRFPLAPLLFELAVRRELTGEVYRGCWFDVGTRERLEDARRACCRAATPGGP